MNIKSWILAARPKTLFVSVAPVLAGSALAYHSHSFKYIPAIICLVFAVLAQITSNFINDYYDFKKGADREDRLGPLRAVSAGLITPEAMLRGTILTISVALLIGLSLVYYGGLWLVVIGLLVAIFAFIYSGGPYPLSYHGFGDLAVVVFYGIVPVVCTYYVQVLSFPLHVWLVSVALGLVGMNLLIVNNYRDMEADIISGKKTTVVRFGRKKMSFVYLFNCLIAFAISCFITTYSCFIMLPFLFVSFILWTKLSKLKGRELNKLLGMTSLNVLFYAISISVALLVS